MSRQPQQVHIYLYRRNPQGTWEFTVFRRSDDPKCWQGVCGGVEEGETIEQAARRELAEEAGIRKSRPLYRLDCSGCVPADAFSARAQQAWRQNVVVVPMVYFAMPFNGEPVLSHEHSEMVWLPYEEAERLVW